MTSRTSPWLSSCVSASGETQIAAVLGNRLVAPQGWGWGLGAGLTGSGASAMRGRGGGKEGWGDGRGKAVGARAPESGCWCHRRGEAGSRGLSDRGPWGGGRH